MPLNITDDLPKTFPTPNYLTLSSFKKGVISLIDKSRLPKDALDEASNVYLCEDGMPTGRPGTDWYGVAMPSSYTIDGFDYFDNSGTISLVVAAGGNIYRSTDDGASWTVCTGATYTAGTPCQMNQYNSKLYIVNGTDYPIMYDGSTTLTQYASLSTPGSAPTPTETGLSGTGYQWYYKYCAVNAVGYSIASSASTKVECSKDRVDWTLGSDYVSLALASVSNAVRYDIFMSTDGTNYYYLDSTATTTYVDNGTAMVIPSTTAPSASTSQGPKVKELTNVGSRMYGVGDTGNPYRIWFSSGAYPYGCFATGTGGGYLDWVPGGKYRPVHVEDYRDGKNNPLATIWCKSADGQGCIIQMSLSDLEIGGYTATIPAAYRLPGSRGTSAPGSVVSVLNDFFFYNSQAIYNLGSRAQFLNLLSTDEASGNIRPTIKQINTQYESAIASVYYDAKVLFSVPRNGSTTNNYTMMYDAERKAWIPDAFTIGFAKFLRYTDTGGDQKLLAYKPGDYRLTEISDQFKGDYDAPFQVSVTTGLYPTTKIKGGFQFVEEGEFELSQPHGEITVELLGTERANGFGSVKTVVLDMGDALLTTGWDNEYFDTTEWDDTSDVNAIDIVSESSVWRYFTVQKELRDVQWRVTCFSNTSGFIARTFQTWGTDTQSGHPRNERLV